MATLSSSLSPAAESLRPHDTATESQPERGSGSVPLWRSGFILALTLIIGLSYLLNPPLTIPPEAGVVMELPDQVGDYHGHRTEFTRNELDELPPDTGLLRKDYDDFRGHDLVISLVLSGAEQRSIHRPEACLVGQGWSIVGQEDLPVSLDSGHPLTVRNLSLERMALDQDNRHVPVRAFFMYWFVGENVTTPSHFTRVFLSSWDRFAHNRAHRWAYPSVFCEVTDNLRQDGLNPAQTKTLMTGFIRRIIPSFQKSEMTAVAP